MRKRVYVAGPLSSSGNRLENVHVAACAGYSLVALGYAPFIPHLTHFVDETDSLGWDAWLEVCLSWIRFSDAVLRLPGESKGADRETSEAKALGIPVVYSIAELQDVFCLQAKEKEDKLLAVCDALQEDIAKRKALGMERYKVPLWMGIGNGRDGIQEAIEETLDLLVYLKWEQSKKPKLAFEPLSVDELEKRVKEGYANLACCQSVLDQEWDESEESEK